PFDLVGHPSQQVVAGMRPRLLRYFLLQSAAHPPELHSFPTRRSSDLDGEPTSTVAVTAVDGIEDPWLAEIVESLGATARGEPRIDRKSTRLNSSHVKSRMPSSA